MVVFEVRISICWQDTNTKELARQLDPVIQLSGTLTALSSSPSLWLKQLSPSLSGWSRPSDATSYLGTPWASLQWVWPPHHNHHHHSLHWGGSWSWSVDLHHHYWRFRWLQHWSLRFASLLTSEMASTLSCQNLNVSIIASQSCYS